MPHESLQRKKVLIPLRSEVCFTLERVWTKPGNPDPAEKDFGREEEEDVGQRQDLRRAGTAS